MNPRSEIRSLFGRRRVCNSSKVIDRRRPILEALEDRTLLASSLVYQAVDDTPLTLLLSGNNVEVVQTADTHVVLASNLLSQITDGVSIQGNGHNVSLTIDASLPASVPGGVLFDGGSGTATLQGPNVNNSWDITGPASGELGGASGVHFTHVANLTGNAGADTFVFADGATLGGSIAGGGGANTLDYSAYQSPVTVSLAANTATGTSSFSGIQSFVGGQASDTLAGPTADSAWNLTGLNSGTVAGVPFTNFENLTGAANNADTFILFPSAQLTGTIDGGAGGSDQMVFDDGNGNRVTYAPTGSERGTLSQGGRTFTYAGMEPTSFYLSNFSDANNVTITGNPIIDNSLSLTRYTTDLVEVSQGNGGESIAFQNPAQSLMIVMGGVGNNTLSIGSTDALVLPGALSINGGSPNNHVVLAGALTLGGGLSINSVTGQTGVTLNAPLTVLAGGLTIDSHLGLNQTVQLNAPARIHGDVSILGSDLADAVTLGAPLDVLGGKLTIECTVTAVDKQLGLDTVTLGSDVNTHGGDFNVDAATINVGPAGPVTVSTRQVDPNNPTTFVGDSGAISFDSRTITIGADSQLLANADGLGIYQPGDVTLNVFVFDPSGALPVDVLPSPNPSINVLTGARIFGGQISLTAHKSSQTQLLPVSLLSVQSKTAEIAIVNATIDGTGVAVTANAEDANALTGTAYNLVNNLGIIPVNTVVAGMIPPIISAVSVEDRSAGASVTVTGSTIHATTGDITVDSTVNVTSQAEAGGGYDATVKKPTPTNPLTVVPYGAGYAQAVGSSNTLINGTTTIRSDSGSVSVTSEATTSATVQTFTASNALFGKGAKKTVNGETTFFPSVAIGVTDTDTTSQTLVGADVQINAKGNVGVNATGNVTNNAWAGTATFGDGFGSVGFTLGTDKTTILSRVDGHITAGGLANVLNVNLSKINQTNDTITIPNHGLQTGQAIVYHAAAPPDPTQPFGTSTPLAPIGGLTDGQTYYVIVKDANTIQLAAAPSIALDATGIDPSVTNTLSSRSVESAAAGAIDLTTSTITLPAHGFTEFQPVTPVTTSDWNIVGLEPQGDYYAHVVDANHIQLLTKIEANAGPTPQRLKGTAYYIVPLAATPAPAGSSAPTLTPAGTLLLGYNQAPVSFNPASAVQPDGTLYLPGNTLQTGDVVTYNVVQGTPTQVAVDRSSLFSPADFDVTVNPNATPTTVANDTIYMPGGTNLVTGQRVTYSAGGGTPIGGLVEGGVYYVVVTPSDDIQLATSQANALNGPIIHLTSSGTGTAHVFHSNAVDTQDDELVIKDHQFATGQRVVYQTAGASPVGGLISGSTYYVIRVSDDLLMLALTRQDASAGIFIRLSGGAGGSQQSLEADTVVSAIDTSQTTPVVDYGDDTIELPGHGLLTGQIINYDPGGGDPIGGLSEGSYSVIVKDADHIQLALTTAPNTPIDLVPLALDTGDQEFTLGDVVFDFDPLLQPTVNLTTSTIWLENNRFATGDHVTYLTGGGTPIGGLVDGQDYVVIAGPDGDSFQLANPATPTTPISLTSAGTGSAQGFERASTGELGSPPIGGLQDGSNYYVTKVDADHIRLSETLVGAQNAATIQLTLTAAQRANPNLTEYFSSSDANPGINVLATLSAQDTQKTESQVGGSPTLSQILLGYLPPGPKSYKAILGAQTNVKTAAPFSAAGAVALNIYTHDVQSIVSSTAVLQSAVDVTINASSQNYSQVIADSQMITPAYKAGNQLKIAAVAVAVAYGSYENTVLATVDSGAHIDAGNALFVTSELTYPDLTRFLPFDPDNFDITSPTNGNWLQNIATALNGRGGLDNLMNVWADSSSTTANLPALISITGSYGGVTYTNDSEATIGSGALINQNQTLQSASQYVGVFADTTMSLLNLAGVIKLQLDLTGLKAMAKSLKNFPISPFGNQAALVGVGGSILLQTVDNTTLAEIESGAMVHTGTGMGGGLGLAATENTVSVNLVLAGGASGVFGLSGAFSILTHTSSTVANLDSGVKVYGGPVDIKSKSDLNYDNIAGAAQVAGAIGVGASGAVNFVTRDTEAYIGAPSQTAVGNAGTVIEATGLSLGAENAGNILGVAVAGAIVDHNLATETSTGTVANAKNSRQEPLPVSVGVAGAVGINQVTDTAESYINDLGAIDLAQGDLKLTSENDTRILAVTGSVSLATLNMITAGLAGSFSQNTLDATTESFLVGAQVADAGKVTLDAERQGEAMAVTIAAAGSAPSPLTSLTLSASITVDVAASVSLNSISGSTLAFIKNGNVQGTKAASLTASDSSTIEADGGGAAIAIGLGGSQALGVAIAAGASVAVNNVTSAVKAYLDHAQVTGGIPINILAQDSSTIDAVTVAGAAVFTNARELGLAFSGAGAGSGNTIHNTILAYLQDCDGLNASSLSLIARDNSRINAEAIAVAMSLALADTFGLATAISMGGSATVNDVGNQVQAFIDNSTITVNGPVGVQAIESSTIGAVSVGAAFAVADVPGGISAAGAGAGAVSTNTISNVVSATIKDQSSVGQTGGGGVTVTALDSATIDASADGGALALGAAGLGIGVGLALGASVATNTITDQILADIDDSTVTSSGGVTVATTTQNNIDALVIALSISLGVAGGGAAPIPIGVAASGAGAAAINSVQNTLIAAVMNGSMVSATGNVQIASSDASSVDANVSAGSLALGTIAIAAGLSVTLNTINNSVEADVDGSSVQSIQGALAITSNSTGNVTATSIGIATALGIGAAAAGATASSTILNTVQAYANNASLSSFGSTQIDASSNLTVSASAAAASVGALGFGISVLVPTVSIGGSTLAYIQGTSTVNAAGLDVHATSDNQAKLPLGLTLAIGVVGAAGAGAGASVSRITQAYVGAESGGVHTEVDVPGGKVSIVATSISSATSNVAGGAFGGIDIGAFIDQATIAGETRAFVGPGATVRAAALDIHATTTENAAADLTALGAGLIGGTGANATASITSVTEAFAGTDTTPTSGTPGVILAITGAIDIVANSTGTAHAQAQGGAGGVIQVTALLANASDDGQTHAYVGVGSNSAVTAGSLNVEAEGALSSDAQSFAIGIGGITVSNVSAESTVGSSDPNQETVAAFMALAPGAVLPSGTFTVNIPGAVTVTANMTPHATAAATGVAAGIVSVDAVESDANAQGETLSYLGDGVTLAAGSLTLDAQRQGSNGPMAQASVTAGSGGVLSDVNAAVSSASSSGTVQASAGSVTLLAGNATIEATNASDQIAGASGVAAGELLAVGVDVATASSGVTTLAQLGPGTLADIGGTLNVLANGTDQNTVSSTSGSGAFFAGSAAIGNTDDTSKTSAVIGGGTIVADTVNVAADNSSGFTSDVSSVNAAALGASGALAHNTDTTAANATVLPSTVIIATFAVDITAHNTFTETLPQDGGSVSAGAGGVDNGTAATSMSNLNGNANVTIGGGVAIDVETPSTISAGAPGIFLIASSALNTNDQVALSSGGVLEGAGTNSSLMATLNNNVVTNSSTAAPNSFTTNQNIGIGAFSTVNATNESEAHTWGVLGALASATATTNVTSNQTITLGPSTNLTAAQNINLTAGDDPTTRPVSPTTMSGFSDAQSYARGFIGIPIANATTNLTSNATLTVGANDQISSGENATLAADHGTPIATAQGIGHGYELGFIPATNGTSSPQTMTTSKVIMNGTVTAGVFHTLDITIPDDRTAADSNGNLIYSHTVNVNGTPITVGTAPGASLVSTPTTVAFTASFDPRFNPFATIQAAEAQGGLSNPGEAASLESAVYNGPVGAMVLGSLYAAGGDVTVHADNLQGTGAINAFGGPTITVTNNSPDYLVLGSISIPNEPGGNVVYTGAATAPPASLTVNSVGASARPVVNIVEGYDQAVPPSSNHGPSVFVTAAVDSHGTVYLDPSGSIDNQAGQVAITVINGSLIQAGSINANQVNITTLNGFTAITNPTRLSSNAGTPETDWDSAMEWPAGYDPFNPDTSSSVPANLASVYMAYVANAMFNAEGQYGTDPNDLGHAPSDITERGTGTGDLGFTEALMGLVGQIPPYSFDDPNGPGEPLTPQIVNGKPQAGTSLEFLGANTGDDTTYGQAQAIADSPVGQFFQFGDIEGRGDVPVVPVEPLSMTASYSQQNPGSNPSAINAEGVFINALYVDINEPINVGQPNNVSLSLPATLNSTIAVDQSHYNEGIYSTIAGDAQGFYTLTPADSPISAQYNAITHQIVVNNVSAASGGFISLEGAILSTNTLGQINVNSDLGQVTINNQTSFPVVVNDISASKSTTSTSLSGVDIIDTNQPAATAQTLYVYQPGNVINEYRGTASQSLQQLEQGAPVVISGNLTSYSPEAGLRWEWQLQTTLNRNVAAVDNGSDIPPFSETPWTFSSVPGLTQNNPWYYLPNVPNASIANRTSQPMGWTVIAPGLADFEETISGSVQQWYMGHYIYHNGSFGFQPTDPPVTAPEGDKAGQLEDPWAYYFATQAELTLTNSVKADNPIGISFSGPAQASVSITSAQPVILAGNIANPLGLTQINAPGITQTASASTTTGNLALLAPGGSVGTAAQPLSASLAAGGVLTVQAGSQGAYLNLGSGALLFAVSAGDANTHGDVVINATGSLASALAQPSEIVNVTGNNIALSSSDGAVGTATAPLEIQASGVVNVSAFGDIGLNQQSGALNVGRIISTSGDVTIDPADSPILNANSGMWASEVGNASSQQVWQDLSLTNPSAAVQQTVAAFQNEVNANYAAYWQLISNGSVTNGVFTLNAAGVALYKGRAGLSLSPATSNPSNAQVQAYANGLYQNYVTFFNLNLNANWAASSDFQAYNPSFRYVATDQQVSDLTSNAAWTTPELMNPVAQVAVNPSAGTPVGVWTPNIAGVNVTLVAVGSGGSIGQIGAATFIALADLQSGNLTAAQLTALGNATAPGDVVEEVTNGQGQTLIVPLGQEPAGFTPTGILVSPTEQLFISATGILNLTAGSSIAIQGTSEDLTLGQVTAGAGVNIAAQGSILGTGSGIQISTPGDTILKAGTGSVGSPSVPLNVNIGGQLTVYTPPGQAFINGGHPTSLTISASTPSTYGQSVTFTATVSDTSTSPAVPTGNVAFYDGTTYLGMGTAHGGSGSTATWKFTSSTLAAGVHASIIAVYSPNGNFSGSSGSLSETITPAPLTITARNASKTYGQTVTFIATTFTETGLLNGDSITGVAESSIGALMSATIGTYDIVPFGAAGKGLTNYTITYVNGTLTVNPAHLTITADNDSKIYGTLKSFSGTAFTQIGLVTANGDTITGVTETSTGAPVSATVGSYPIAISAATGNRLNNYIITYVNSTLTVNPAPLTISANNDSKTYGTLKTFTTTAFTQTGLVTANGDTITGVIETSTGSPVSAEVGNYPIVPTAATGNRLSNYVITYVNGALTVNPAPLTITANNDSKPFGTVKTFSPTAFTQSGLVTVNGDTITGVTETSAGAPAPAPVGTYPIVPTAATGNRLNNYIITYVNGTLTVNQSIIVLDPTAGGALSLSGSSIISLAGGVFVDSSSSSALTAGGNASIKASVIDVHGGVTISGNAGFRPTPVTGTATLADPLSGLASPSTSGLTNYGSESLSGNASATIQPGIYSGINVSGSAKLTMNSGLYIIEGGGFSVSGNASVSGAGVTIFNAGSKYPTTGGTYGSINLSGTGSFSLSPPATGTYAGVVIFQPADNTKGLSVSGNAASVTGEIYAPNAQLNETGNGQLNASIVVDTMTLSGQSVANTITLSATAGNLVYTPAQIRDAYGINALALDGTGQTIAIVAAYDNPSIFQSLDAFDTQFERDASGRTLYDQYGPASSFLTVFNQHGKVAPLPPTDPNGPGTDNWEVEEALDVEWAHAIAPGARIILVEASSSALSDLMAGVAAASRLPGVSVVSMSWGLPEGRAVFADDEANYDGVFNVPGVTFLASTGDYGTADPEYPAFASNVVAVGGTSLHLNADQSYNTETEWGGDADSLGMSIGSGGGISMYEPEPAYQQGIQSTGGRTTPDVSLVGDPATGVWVADTYNLRADNPFEDMGGTSLSAPAWAGLIALVNEGRVASGKATLNRVTPTDTQQALYSLPQSDYNAIAISGFGYNVDSSYNIGTGLGTPVANRLVPDLIAYQGLGTTYTGPTVSPLPDATLIGGDWSHGGGTANASRIFSVLTTKGTGFSEVLGPDASLVTGMALSLDNLTPTAAATKTAIAALGSPFALAPDAFSGHRTAPPHGSISNSTSAGVTSAPLVGVTSPWFSTGLALQSPVWSKPRPEVFSTSLPEYQALWSGMDRQNLYADGFVPARSSRGLLPESVLDNLAAGLHLSPGRDGAAPANVPAIRPQGVTEAEDAMGPGSHQDQDVPSTKFAVGLMVFGLAAKSWARRSGILNARKWRSGSRPSRSKYFDLTPGNETS